MTSSLFRSLLPCVLLAAPILSGQSATDETAVLNAAVTHIIELRMPYVQHWQVGASTEALPKGANAALDGPWRTESFETGWRDYGERNARPILLDLQLPARASILDLPASEPPAVPNQSLEDLIYTIRAARPGFVNENTAIVRVDVWNASRRITIGALYVLGWRDGTWRVLNNVWQPSA